MNQERSRICVPVRNRYRAIAFYSALFGIDLADDDASVLLRFEVREGPALIHLSIDSLDEALEAVWSNGGRVLEPERLEDNPVRQVLVMDSEGNRLALQVTV